LPDDLVLAKKIMLEGDASLVVVRDGDVLFIGRSGGLKDLAKIALEEPSLLEGSSIADKVVGKAAALIFSMNRAKAVYASLISSYGLEELQKAVSGSAMRGSSPISRLLEVGSAPSRGSS